MGAETTPAPTPPGGLLRALAERLSRRVVLRRRLPAAFGGHRLYVTPDSALSLWRPGLSRANPLLLAWAEELVEPGSVVWDVGANLGLFAFPAAHRAGPDGRVVAVEADERLTALIRRSAATAPATYAPVTVLTAAVSSRLGLAELCIARRGRSASHLRSAAGSTQAGGVRTVQETVTVSLDWLLEQLPAPALLKIDVEGAEADCLEGATRLLAEVRPALLCEVGDDTAPRVAAILGRHGYRLFDARRPPGRRSELDHPTWDTLALPAERPEAAG